jgi:hypothetical protein
MSWNVFVPLASTGLLAGDRPSQRNHSHYQLDVKEADRHSI